MKKLILGLLVGLVLVSVASAEVMMSACPLGKGKWDAMFGVMSDVNYGGFGGMDYMSMYALGYGLNNNLDLYVSTGLGYSATAPRMGKMTMNSYGLNLKYTFIGESLTQPLSWAVNAGIKSTPMSMTSMNQMQGSLGIIVSKMVRDNFNPYASVTYRATNQSYGNYSQIDYTLGAGIGPMDKMLMLEYTAQLMSLTGGTSYATNVGNNVFSSQITLGACFGLN